MSQVSNNSLPILVNLNWANETFFTRKIKIAENTKLPQDINSNWI